MDTIEKDISEMEIIASTDEGDSKSFGDFFKKKGESEKDAIMPIEKDSHVYNMRHKGRGKAVIFNHKEYHNGRLATRNGTDADRDALKNTLLRLQFDVHVFDNLTKKQLLETINSLATDDHSERDCILVAVFSHGDLNRIHAHDGDYSSHLLWDPFTANLCPTLAGKPKIFLIQACQGDQLDSGTRLAARTNRTMVDSVSEDTHYTVPNRADFLTVYSTVPGYYSWRNTTDGSWFIQSLCKVLKEHSESRDFLSMLTIVARYVALNHESFVPSIPHMDRKKQVPLITSTLTRDIFF